MHILQSSTEFGIGATSVGSENIPLPCYKRPLAYHGKVALRKIDY